MNLEYSVTWIDSPITEDLATLCDVARGVSSTQADLAPLWGGGEERGRPRSRGRVSSHNTSRYVFLFEFVFLCFFRLKMMRRF